MTKQLSWFRLHTDILNDEKILSIAVSDRWYFVVICCLKCDGMLDKYTGPELDRKVRIKIGLDASETSELKRRLMEEHLIDDDWQPCAWEYRQFKSDSSAERTRKWREKQRDSEVKRHGDVTVTPPEYRVQSTENRLQRTERGKDITIDPLSGFQQFWDTYDHKKARSKCEAIWKRKKLSRIAVTVITGAQAYVRGDGRNKKYRKHPEGWLNAERWNDEQTKAGGRYDGVSKLINSLPDKETDDGNNQNSGGRDHQDDRSLPRLEGRRS